MQVRRFDERDREIIAWHTQAIAMESEGRMLDDDAIQANLEGLFERGTAQYFVCEDDTGRALGSLMVTREWSDWKGQWYWWIQSVYTRPEARRQGVYQELLSGVRQAAKEQGNVAEIRLYVEEDNEAGRLAHEASGFRRLPYQIMVDTRYEADA